MTPGNWIVNIKGDWAYIYSDHDGTCTPKGTPEETAAAAAVISASKDLLDACEHVFSRIASLELGDWIDSNKIQLAIAKAKGGMK